VKKMLKNRIFPVLCLFRFEREARGTQEMRKREPSPLDVLEARVAQLAAALAVLAPAVRAEAAADPAAPDARALRGFPPVANDRRSSGP
jgi:hypothetical protein